MLTRPQSDNKIISSKLAEKIAEERAKALLRSVENRKRPAEDLAMAASPASEEPRSKKKPKHNKSKGMGKGKGKGSKK